MRNARGKLVLGALAVVAVILIVALASNLLGQIGSLRGGAGDASSASSDSASQQGEKAAKPYSISFTSTGDLIFWREVGDYIDQNGGASAMANISDFLAQADVTIANVESPLSKDESEPITDKDVYIIGKPSVIESIQNSGIDLASLANNHIMDYGKPALEDTLKALDGVGVLHAGAGLTEDEAAKMAEMEVDGVSIAFFSWTDIVPDYFLAYGDEPGVVSARMNMADACKRVSEAKATHDIVIVPCTGASNTRTTSPITCKASRRISWWMRARTSSWATTRTSSRESSSTKARSSRMPMGIACSGKNTTIPTSRIC